ncbi:MAG: hypothetical protein EA423_06145 [Phycisphaerales bacterium]|nr:MAG: hypothetical protein EA423_06145 [Phycisphaerales bacterium]
MALGGLSLFKQKASVGLLRQGTLPIAVDFGSTALKLLQVSGSETPTLIAAATLPTPDTMLYDEGKRLAYQMEQLPSLLKSSGFKGKRVVAVVPGGRTFCKHLQIQKTEGVALRSMIDALLPEQLGCPTAAVVYRHTEVEGVSEQHHKAEVICMATPRELVARLMTLFRGCKLEPVGIHNEFGSLLRACRGIRETGGEDARPTLYMDLGWTRTKVVIAHGDRMVFARLIDIGGRAFDEAVCGQTKLPLSEARRERLAMERVTPGAQAPAPEGDGGEQMAVLSAGMAKAGGGATRAKTKAGVKADLSEPLEMLVDEIGHCLRYHESLFGGRRVERAVLVGGEARHRALGESVARAIRVEAQIADPMAGVARTGREPSTGVDFSQAQPGWAQALGACLSPTDL